MKLSMGKIPSLFSSRGFLFSLLSLALIALLVVHWEWCQLLRKNLISWSNYLFWDGLYPKLISHSIFGSFIWHYCSLKQPFEEPRGAPALAAGAVPRMCSPEAAAKEGAITQALEGFPIAVTAHCLQNDFAHLALGFVALHIFIPAGGNADLFINNVVGKNYICGLSGDQRQLWAWLQF